MAVLPPFVGVVVFVCVCHSALAHAPFNLSDTDEVLFAQFVDMYGRTYSSTTEKALRFSAFQLNAAKARELQRSAHEHGDPVRFGITAFSDYTAEELHRLTHGARGGRAAAGLGVGAGTSCQGCPLSGCAGVSLPDAFDWRSDARGVITAVRDQGHCGGCWAFCVTETVESAWVIANRTLPGPLSVQQLLSCDVMDKGCSGGYVREALDFVMEQQPLGPDSTFPFQCGGDCPAGSMPRCPAPFGPAATINASYCCGNVPEDAMRCLLLRVGPLGVRVDADPWVAYQGGIIRRNCAATPEAGDHAVQLTGFGVDTSTSPPTPYWILRNSWGTSFGEDGYVRIARNANVCGITNDIIAATSPAV